MALSLCVSGVFAQDANKVKSEGDEALKAKNYTVAFTKYDQYLKTNNNQDSVTVFNCGLSGLNSKNYAGAVKYFDISIKNNYQLPMSYAGKAQALRNMGKTAEMLTTIEAGLKVVPGDNNLEKLYAIHYLKEGQKFQQAGGSVQGAGAEGSGRSVGGCSLLAGGIGDLLCAGTGGAEGGTEIAGLIFERRRDNRFRPA